MILAHTLTALVITAIHQAHSPKCTLAGPPVDAHWTGSIPSAPTTAAPLRLVADIPLPGTSSRFDYQSLDHAMGRLFVAHMGAGQLVVFDTRSARVIGTLEGFPTVTGVLAVPAEHRVYASAAGAHAVIARIPVRTASPRRVT